MSGKAVVDGVLDQGISGLGLAHGAKQLLSAELQRGEPHQVSRIVQHGSSDVLS